MDTPREHTGETPQEDAAEQGILDALPQYYGLGADPDTRILRRALAFAVVAHVVFLFARWPFEDEPLDLGVAKPSKVFVMEQPRFKPPAVQPRQEIPKKKARRIPIPDPTPDEPEPIEIDEIEAPEVPLVPDTDFILGIPDAPPGPSLVNTPGVFQVGSGVTPPVKVFHPQPLYTEEARRARIQGIVLLEAIVDAEGNVVDVAPLKGLTMGLTEKAVETLRTWKYRPALKDGKPVPVYINVAVRFSLQ